MSKTIQLQQYDITFPRIEELQRILKVVSKLTEEPIIRLSPEGLSIREMDYQHCVLMNLWIPASEFRVFRVNAPVQISFRVKALLSLLKTKKCEVRLLNDSEVPDTMNIRYNSREYKLNLIETIRELYPVPELNFGGYFVTSSNPDFIRILEDAEAINADSRFGPAGHITLILANDQVKIKAENPGVAKFFTKLTLEDRTLEEAKLSDPTSLEPVVCSYKIKDLMQFLKTSAYKDNIKVEFGNKNPLKISLPIGAGFLEYYQAPFLEK